MEGTNYHAKIVQGKNIRQDRRVAWHAVLDGSYSAGLHIGLGHRVFDPDGKFAQDPYDADVDLAGGGMHHACHVRVTWQAVAWNTDFLHGGFVLLYILHPLFLRVVYPDHSFLWI